MKEVEISGKKYNLTPLTYLQAVSLNELGTVDKIKKMLSFSTNMTEEEINQLGYREGVELQKAINELNGLSVDFQEPAIEEKKE